MMSTDKKANKLKLNFNFEQLKQMPLDLQGQLHSEVAHGGANPTPPKAGRSGPRHSPRPAFQVSIRCHRLFIQGRHTSWLHPPAALSPVKSFTTLISRESGPLFIPPPTVQAPLCPAKVRTSAPSLVSTFLQDLLFSCLGLIMWLTPLPRAFQWLPVTFRLIF